MLVDVYLPGRNATPIKMLRLWSEAVIDSIKSGKCSYSEIVDECQALVDAKQLPRPRGLVSSYVAQTLQRLKHRNRIKHENKKWVMS